MMNREEIYSALWNKLSAIEGFTTKSRRLRHWNDVQKGEQPAIFMNQTGEVAVTKTRQPTKWTLSVDVYLYARTDGAQTPGSVLNPLLDAVCQSINEIHPVTGLPTLDADGVEWCRIDGRIETDEGALGDQVVAIIPVVIFAT
jgi:hypothetical protein